MLRVIFYHYTCPVTTVCFDDGETTVAPMLGLSLALGRREGNFVVAPHAELDDGLFDYVYGGAANRWNLLVFVARWRRSGWRRSSLRPNGAAAAGRRYTPRRR